jgi:hypothetical protein
VCRTAEIFYLSHCCSSLTAALPRCRTSIAPPSVSSSRTAFPFSVAALPWSETPFRTAQGHMMIAALSRKVLLAAPLNTISLIVAPPNRLNLLSHRTAPRRDSDPKPLSALPPVRHPDIAPGLLVLDSLNLSRQRACPTTPRGKKRGTFRQGTTPWSGRASLRHRSHLRITWLASSCVEHNHWAASWSRTSCAVARSGGCAPPLLPGRHRVHKSVVSHTPSQP